jgi:uncharacterized SAM-binding protein YcdF (DUF218 family)
MLPRRTQPIIRVLLLLLPLFLGFVAWFDRDQILRGAEELWIISDPVGPADAVVVLGGGLDTRPFLAAEYYREGLTPRILLSSVHQSRNEELGLIPSHTDLNRKVLIGLGVPESAIEPLGHELSSTYEEVIALRDWVLRNHPKSIIVPTEYFNARRVRWILTHLLSGTDIRIRVPAVKEPDYPPQWWTNEKAIVAFQNEILKYFYYRLKY